MRPRVRAVRLPRPFAMRGFVALVALIGMSTLAACGGKDTPAPVVRPVVAATVHRSTQAPQFLLPGTIQARNSTPLSFRLGGKIVERRAKLGARVKAGEVLASIDSADLQTQTESARAQLKAAQEHLDAATLQLERDWIQARDQLIAQAQLEQTKDAYAAAVAQREQARQQLALAQRQQRYATLVADRAGVISAEYAETGQNVSAGQPIYGLVWEGGIDAISDVSETTISALRIGQPATVSVLALPDTPLRASVREFSPVADPQSRTYRVKFSIDEPPAALRPGMTVSVAITNDRGAQDAPNASYTLPATALFHDGASPALWIVTPQQQALELRRVQIARFDADSIDVISGLKDGETVVVQGVHTVSAGQKVRVVAPLHEESPRS